MSVKSDSELSRRELMKTGAAATALTLASTASSFAAPDAAKPAILPRRPLGKTGIDVTILNQGMWKPESMDILLRRGYAGGIRYIDTAKTYGSEPAVAKYFETMPAGTRKEYFLVTKDHPRTPRDLIKQLDDRLAALKTDYVDLFFIHGIGPGEYGKESLEWPKSKELKDTIETIKKSGKARFVGFSCHDALKAEYLMAAAEGKIVDAIMVAHTPWLDKDAPFNRALDACHKAGIGLISMKQVAGNGDKLLKEVAQHVPTLKEKGLTAYQGLLHAIWTDERISSCCVSMRNEIQLRENMHAARVFEPLKQAEMDQLHKAIIASGPTFCANCDGSCGRAAGTEANLGELTRLLTYHDHYGFRSDARRLYSKLSDTDRNWQGADLEAARAACPNKLDFASLLPRVDRNLA